MNNNLKMNKQNILESKFFKTWCLKNEEQISDIIEIIKQNKDIKDEKIFRINLSLLLYSKNK